MARAVIFYGYSWQSLEEFGFSMHDFHALYTWEEEQLEQLAAAGRDGTDHRRGSDEWQAQQEAAERALGALMESHGGHDDDEPRSPHLRAAAAPHWWADEYRRGDAIDPAILSSIDPEWKTALDRYLAVHGIKPPEGPNQPGWWLLADGHI